jgi:hypothetical protein
MWTIAPTVALGSALGCARANPVFDEADTDGAAETTGKDTGRVDGGSVADGTDGGSAGATSDATTGVDPSATSGFEDTGVVDSGTDPTDSGMGSTGVDAQHRITLYGGPTISSDAATKAGKEAFDFGMARCDNTFQNQQGLECPGGQTWALLAMSSSDLAGFVSLPNGEFLQDAQVFAADGTLIALSYDDLITGQLQAPIVGHVVDGNGDASFWWGQTMAGVLDNCSDWTVYNNEATGSIVIADNITPTLFHQQTTCDQSLPILCMCF